MLSEAELRERIVRGVATLERTEDKDEDRADEE